MAYDSRAFKRILLEESPSQESQSAAGAEAIRFVFVTYLQDIAATGVHPAFINNVFDGAEDFPGYSGLDIAIFVTAGSLKHYVKIAYDDCGPMDILAVMKRNVYEDALLDSMEEFTTAVTEEFHPTGSVVYAKTQGKDTYEIYRNSMETPGFLEYHQRLRTLPVWFIDGGSIVISTEPHWVYFTLYHRCQKQFALVGLASCYIYYQSADKSRVRISQVLVLPQFQRRGFGAMLLEAVYREFRSDSSVFEITVEDCSLEMQHVRDLTDLKDVLMTGIIGVRETPIGGKWEKSVVEQVRNRLKITENQVARVGELIQYAKIDEKDEDQVGKWRRGVKKRLFALNYEELRPRPTCPELKHIYIHDDSDSEMSDEMVQKLMQDVGPLQKLSASIADDVKQLAGQKRADRQYLPTAERLEKLQGYFEAQKAEYDPIREKVAQFLAR